MYDFNKINEYRNIADLAVRDPKYLDNLDINFLTQVLHYLRIDPKRKEANVPIAERLIILLQAQIDNLQFLISYHKKDNNEV